MSTSFQVRTLEAVLREMVDGLKNRGNRKEYLTEEEFMLLKMAWADFAIGLVDASGTLDKEHQEKTKEERYTAAMKILL